jgi:hypothetical protein
LLAASEFQKQKKQRNQKLSAEGSSDELCSVTCTCDSSVSQQAVQPVSYITTQHNEQENVDYVKILFRKNSAETIIFPRNVMHFWHQHPRGSEYQTRQNKIKVYNFHSSSVITMQQLFTEQYIPRIKNYVFIFSLFKTRTQKTTFVAEIFSQ